MSDAGTLGARFDAVATRYADAIALNLHAQTPTYAQLRALTDHLATLLAARGYPAGSRIALLFEQGIEPIAMMLGVLKAGQVFVQLDSKDPVSRLRTIMQDCTPAAIVASGDHLAPARTLAGDAEVLDYQDLVNAAPQAGAPHAAAARDIAYILYTSGSTGEPKGVCQTHANLLHFVDVYAARLRLAHHDRLSMLYTLGFSAANLDIFGALLTGATLCLYNLRRRGIADLPEWLNNHAITVLHTVPSVFRALTAGLPAAQRFESVRIIDLGGEALYARDVRALARHFSRDCVLLNHYAATEASVIAQHEITPADCIDGEALPAGQPATGMAVTILRDDGTPAPAGETGEIVLCSRHLSPGYWRREAMTAAAFADDPSTPGLRSYRSGDLGYLDAQGRLRHAGRKDQRVKIHGQSVYLSEVEAALDALEGIDQHAVVVRGEAAAQHLAAFIVAAPAHRHAARLRKQLQARLPGYMVPQALLFIDAMPMTATGKIDRRALAASAQVEADDDRACVAPDGALEADIARLYEKILERQPIGRDADFFLLGGDSLRAIQLHLELEDLLARKIPLESLFKDATVKGLAGFVRGLDDADTAAPPPGVLVPLQRGDGVPPLFLVHGRNAQAFVSPHFLDIIGPEQPLYAFQATALDRASKANYSVREMADVYVDALRTIQPTGPYLLSGLCVGAMLTIEMAMRLRAAGQTVAPLLLIDPHPYNPGDLPEDIRARTLAQLRQALSALDQSTDHWAKQKLRKRVRQGRIALDTDNTSAVNAAAHAMIDFNIALHNYHLQPFDGPILIMSSDDRINQFAGGATNIRDKLLRVQRVFRVGRAHADVLDAGNDLFARQLREAVSMMHSTIARQPSPVS